MQNSSLLMLLRVIHIGAGIFWVGGVVVVGVFVMPAARATGASGQQMLMDIMLKRKLATYLPIAAMLTTLAGLTLFWRNESLSGGVWAQSSMGKGMSFGAAAAILAAIAGMAIAAPSAKKLARSGAPGTEPLTPQQLESLQRRAALGSQAAMVLLIVATLAMAVSRYL
jgi:uncharacterized membrane protein